MPDTTRGTRVPPDNSASPPCNQFIADFNPPMNANTRLRLWKEARALLPFWVAMAALVALPFLFHLHEPLHFAWSAYIFGCALLGSVVIGQEFQHRTMGLLLSQPVSRRRLWWEKMFVLGAALLGLLLWLGVLGLIEVIYVRDVLAVFGKDFGQDHAEQVSRLMEVEQLRAEFFKWPDALVGIAILLLPLLLGFCTGPVLTLLVRSTIGGVVLTFMCPWAIGMVGFLLMDLMWGGDNLSENDSLAVFLCLFAVPCLYLGGLVLLGCRRFQRFEDASTLAQDVSLPAQLTQPFARLTERLTLGRGSALGHLLRKELRIHLPAFVVAGMLVALWLLLLAAVLLRPYVSKAFLLLPSILLSLGIPLLVGIVSTAEERSLGLLDWHLTLPVSARRQWLVKVLVALGVNVVLGLVLPNLLGHAPTWMFNDPRLLDVIPSLSNPLLVANAVLFCAALYASTASANSMRALVGTIVLFVAVSLLLFPLLDYLGRQQPEFFSLVQLLSQVLIGFGFDPMTHFPVLRFIAFCGGIFLPVVLLLFLGLANFRRSLGSFWRPVRQMVGFFAVIAILLIALTILGRSMDHLMHHLKSGGWSL